MGARCESRLRGLCRLEFGSKSFDSFLRNWLAQQQPQPVVDLFRLGRNSTQRIAGVEGNLTFIREERVQLRAMLLRAARAGKLLYQDGALLSDFLENGDGAATSAQLDELDEIMK